MKTLLHLMILLKEEKIKLLNRKIKNLEIIIRKLSGQTQSTQEINNCVSC